MNARDTSEGPLAKQWDASASALPPWCKSCREQRTTMPGGYCANCTVDDEPRTNEAPPESPNRINPGARVYMRGAPSSRGTVDGWIGPSHVRVAWDSGHRGEVIASSLIVIRRGDATEQRTQDTQCVQTSEWGCEARRKLGIARGGLASVKVELMGMADELEGELRDTLNFAIEQIEKATDESAMPQVQCSDNPPPDPPLDIVRGRGIIEAALHWHARSEAGLTTAVALAALEKAIRETPKREDVETQIAKLAEALASCMANNDTAEDRLSKFRAALRMAFATPRPTVDLDYPQSFRAGANAARTEALRMINEESWEHNGQLALRALARRCDELEPAPRTDSPKGGQ